MDKKSKSFYCWGCREFTKQIPKYSEGWKGKKYIAEYKCVTCGTINYPSQYTCPKCGAESNEDTWIESSEERYDYAASMNYGSCYEWEEKHKCWHCGTIYEFTNSNC